MNNKEIHSLTENKLIILFVLKQIDMPITNIQTTNIIMKKNMMNYFDLQHYLSELVNIGHIDMFEDNEKQFYRLTEKGLETLSYFENRIDYTIREDILSTIQAEKKIIQKSTEIISNHFPLNENEYVVECKIIENDTALIDLKLTVGTKKQAKSICEFWKSDPQHIYAQIIRTFTDQKD